MSYNLPSIVIGEFLSSTDESKSCSFGFGTAAGGTSTTLVLPAASRTLTLPNDDTTLVGDTTIISVLNGKSLTGVTIDASLNTISNLDSTAIIGGAYAVGDILYADTTSTLAALAGVATGNALISGGVGTAPSYGKIGLTTHVSGTLPQANGGTGFTVYAVGDLLYADTTSTLAKLADVATGNALISGGVGVAPSWGKISLTTAISGVLPVANGGTNSSAALTGKQIMVSNTGATAVVEAGAMTNGQLLIGSTGAQPAIAAVTGTAGVAVTNGAGSITLKAPRILTLSTVSVTAGAANTQVGWVPWVNADFSGYTAGVFQAWMTTSATRGITAQLFDGTTVLATLTAVQNTANAGALFTSALASIPAADLVLRLRIIRTGAGGASTITGAIVKFT